VTILTALALMCMVLPAHSLVDFNQEFEGDKVTLGLWHFNEVSGTTAHDSAPLWIQKQGPEQIGGYDAEFAYGLVPANTWDTGVFGGCISTYDDTVAGINEGGLIAPQDGFSATKKVGLGVGPTFNLTIEFWFCPQRADATPKYILKKGDAEMSDYRVEWIDQKIQVSYYSTYLDGTADTPSETYDGTRYDTGYMVTIIDTNEVDLDTWTHIAITMDRTSRQTLDEITFYQNGIMTHQEVAPAEMASFPWQPYDFAKAGESGDPGDLGIMCDPDNSSSDYFVHGKLDELRISGCIRAYTEPRVDSPTDWLWPYTGADSYTIALYHLNETSGRTAYDIASAYGANNATTTGAAYGFDNNTGGAEVVSPAFDRSYDCRAIDKGQTLMTPTGGAPGSFPSEATLASLSQLTAEAWVKIDNHYPRDFSFCRQVFRIPHRIRFGIVGSRLWGEGQNWLVPSSSWSAEGMVPVKKWTHIAMVYDCLSEKNYTKLYVNGRECEYQPDIPTWDGIEWRIPHLNGGHDYAGSTVPVTTVYIMPLMIAGKASGDANKLFEGKIDEVRISACARTFNPLALRILGIARDISDNIKLSIQAAGDQGIYLLKFGADMLNKTGWDVQSFSGDFAGVEYIDAGVVASNDQMFYQVEEFTATSQGHVAIAEKSVTVDANLSEWSQSDLLVTRDNFYPKYLGEQIPYEQNDIYAAYDSTTDTPVFYFAFEVDEISASDEIEFAFANPIDSAVYQVQIAKSGAVSYYKITGLYDWLAIDGYMYTTPGTSVTVSTVTAGGTWSGELKVEYKSFIHSAYTFDAGEQRTIFVNRSSDSGSQLGTTNPDGYFWAWHLQFGDLVYWGDPLTYFDPGVGVSR
jgi:Concanavalin A-like lectin/glucanases superfamily